MDDFEELLISESDDDNKNEINNQYYDININNIKIPSNDIFKGLLSDDSEESNKIVEINKKRKEENKIKENKNLKNKKKKKKIIFNLSHSINKTNNNNFNSDIIQNQVKNTESNNDNININNSNQKNLNNNNNTMNYNISNTKNVIYSYKNDKNTLINNSNTKNGIINKNINQVTNNQNGNKNNINNPQLNSLKSNKFKDNLKKQNINNDKNLSQDSIEINSESPNQNINDIQSYNNINQIKKEDKKIEYNMSEMNYSNLKPKIDKIISLELTEIKDIQEQNSKIKFYLEELNIILKSINHKKLNNFDNLFNEEHLNKIEIIANNYKEDYQKIRDRMQNVSEKDYITLDEKESILDDIEYYNNKIKSLKTLNRVNENILSSNEKNPQIKEMWVKNFEINFQNFKLENEKLNKMIKRNKDKVIKNDKTIEDLNKKLSDLQNNAKKNYNIDNNFDKEIFGIVNKDLMIEKENTKKKLEVILNFSDFEMKKYENYISNKEVEIEKKTIEKTKLLNILNKEKEKTEITQRDFENYLIPLQKFHQELKKRQEIAKKEKLEEILIKRARKKIEENEKKEKQKRDKIIFKQSMSLEKMKQKLEKNIKKNKNKFNIKAYSERNNTKTINNISRNNNSNNHFFLTENNQSKVKENKFKNPKLMIQIDDNNFETITNDNKNGNRIIKSETLPVKKKSKISDKEIKLIYDEETINNYKMKKSTNKKNKIEDDYNDENKNVSDMNTKNDESFSSNDDNYLQKLLIKNNKKDDEYDENINDNYELKNKKMNKSEEKNLNIINLKRDSVRNKRTNTNFVPYSERIPRKKIDNNKKLRMNSEIKHFIRHESLITEKKKLSNNDINFNIINKGNEKFNLVTPKFKDLSDDKFDSNYNKNTKSKFQNNSIKKFEEKDYDFDLNDKNIKNDNSNEVMNQINYSSKNSIFSINKSLKNNTIFSPLNNFHINNLTSSNKKNRSNIQIDDLTTNFKINIPNLKQKMNCTKINNNIIKHREHKSYIIRNNSKLKQFIDDNISDIGKNHLNSEKGRNESFFSSDENLITDEIIKDKKNRN